MADQRDDRSTTDQILDLLLDALAERQKARLATRQGTAGSLPGGVQEAPSAQPGPQEKPSVQAEAKAPTPAPRPLGAEARVPRPGGSSPENQPETPRPAPRAQDRVPPARVKPAAAGWPKSPPQDPQPGEEGWEPPPRQPSINMGKMIGRLAILVAALIIVVNIPVNSYGVSLARIMPEASSLIIRDGLVLKGSGPEIYVLEDDRLRWISSLDAFEHLRLTWEDVHVVDDAFLDKFEEGRPIHVLLKCQDSPHIYRLENDQKRWIKDIDTFLAEGHQWEDVRFTTCQYLRDLPTGPSIPEDAGPAPEP
ncbi:MAG: hypothetical protein M8467_19220 [Anaerolineae bacterium]|nr:hypothetical protein [Anaerolineae bacterium]